MMHFPLLGGLLLGCSPDKQVETGQPPQEESCTEYVEGVMDLAPGMPSTQIHPDSVMAGGEIWLAYNVPDETGIFDVYLQSIRCDGSTGHGPERIDTPEGHNETYPRLAASGDTILLAWQTDSGETPYNLSINWQLLDSGGSALSEVSKWQPTIGGEDVEGNAWMPSLAALPGGGFALGGSVGLRSNGFSLVVQQLSADGDWGDGLEIEPIEEGSQYEATLGAGGDGSLWVAWKADQDIDTVRHARLETDGGLQIVQEASGIGDTAVQGGPSYSSDWEGAPLLAYHQANASYDIYAASTLIENPGTDHLPHIVKGESLSLVAWFHVQSGLSNDLMLAHVDGSGEISEPWTHASEPATAPYRAAVAHAGGDVFFVAWAQGESPDFRLAGSFVSIGGE
jgi:hypothetical protein